MWDDGLSTTATAQVMSMVTRVVLIADFSSGVLSDQDGLADAYVPTISGTLPKTNIAPENGWLEYYFLLGWPWMANF